MPPVPGANPVQKEKKRRKQPNASKATTAPHEREEAKEICEETEEVAAPVAAVNPLEATYGCMYTPVRMQGVDELVLAARRPPQVLNWTAPSKEHLAAQRRGTQHRGRGVGRAAPRSTTALLGEDSEAARERSFVPDPSRGLANSTNACFLNATMQAVAHIPALAQLLVSCALEHQLTVVNQKSKIFATAPTSVAMGSWIQQYYQLPALGEASGYKGALSSPSLPSLTSRHRTMTGASQEDASEFLQLFLETVQQELRAYEDLFLAAPNHEGGGPLLAAFLRGECNDGGASSKPEGKGWVTVGKSKGDAFTIKTARPKSIPPSFCMDTLAFGGMMHHQLKGGTTTRNKGVTSVRAQPFFVLPVEVGGASRQTIEEALKFTCARETIENDERGTVMTKQERIGVLPQTLVVQIKRWAVTAEGEVVKLDNLITFGPTLIVPGDIVAQGSMPGAERTYTLSSVVCHRGVGMAKGHYVTYLNNCPPSVVQASEDGGRGHPLNLCDDFRVTASTLAQAWTDSPYFLFYRKVAPTAAKPIKAPR